MRVSPLPKLTIIPPAGSQDASESHRAEWLSVLQSCSRSDPGSSDEMGSSWELKPEVFLWCHTHITCRQDRHLGLNSAAQIFVSERALKFAVDSHGPQRMDPIHPPRTAIRAKSVMKCPDCFLLSSGKTLYLSCTTGRTLRTEKSHVVNILPQCFQRAFVESFWK